MEGEMPNDTALTTGYAPVNDLNAYFEIHGEGEPLVLLHGAYMSIDAMAPLLRPLAEHRQVIALELQGHGRTADADRPITYEGMADDTAAVMTHLGIERADVVGYSMGAGVGLQMAIRHPERVRKLVGASTAYAYDGMPAEAIEMFPTITPEMFKGGPMEAEYKRLAPHPDDFENLVWKLKTLDTTHFDWSDGVRGISAPVLIVVGDSDVVRLEHVVELFRMLGGGVMGDLAGLPKSQLAVLPGTSHFMPPGSGVLDRAELMLAMIRPFLDAE
jgi:pimeloyl-ACP methyl ester carboxylesterase